MRRQFTLFSVVAHAVVVIEDRTRRSDPGPSTLRSGRPPAAHGDVARLLGEQRQPARMADDGRGGRLRAGQIGADP